MARKAILVNETKEQGKQASPKTLTNRLKKLIPVYGQNKSQMDELKKVVDGDNKEIKAICKELSVTDLEIDGWKMNYSVVNKHHTDEDKMLAIIKSWWSEHKGSMHCPYIEIKECINVEAVQDAIYNGEFDKETLLKIRACDKLKPEEKLKVSRVKEK